MNHFLDEFPSEKRNINFLMKLVSKEIKKTNYEQILNLKIQKNNSEMLENLNNKKIIKKKPIKTSLKKILKEEKNNLEKIAFKIILNKKVRFDNFKTKLFFIYKFDKIWKFDYSLKFKKHEYILQELIFILFYQNLNENEKKENLNQIYNIFMKLKPHKKTLYYLLLKDIIEEDFFYKLINSLENHPILLTFFTNQKFIYDPSKLIVKEILNTCSTMKYKIISSVCNSEIEKNHFLTVLTKNYTIYFITSLDKKYFEEILDLLTFFQPNNTFQTFFCFSWMRTFLFTKNLELFFEIYNFYIKYNKKTENTEFLIYKYFCDSFLFFKEKNIFNLNIFKESCNTYNDTNEEYYVKVSLLSKIY
ncbi:hypothetical protein CWI36_1271p0010 [Hamiltosporidium magnivora]|uniref:Uncharacterized protein n=1 Tax=Hamiltosporidium magnivora TaxID=148818 RepID=A0A4V2JUW5_9MICR|nr:hypothetical protein CWI36_1271p0010 [Hamiltosporidium magnivora]